MLEVLAGELYQDRGPFQRSPTDYMRDLLSHVPWGDDTSFGYGVPPGTVISNKIGGKLESPDGAARSTSGSGLR